MIFIDKLNNEVVSDGFKFMLWVKKFEHWVGTQVTTAGMDVKVTEFFRLFREAPERTNTDLFDDILRRETKDRTLDHLEHQSSRSIGPSL